MPRLLSFLLFIGLLEIQESFHCHLLLYSEVDQFLYKYLMGLKDPMDFTFFSTIISYYLDMVTKFQANIINP